MEEVGQKGLGYCGEVAFQLSDRNAGKGKPHFSGERETVGVWEKGSNGEVRSASVIGMSQAYANRCLCQVFEGPVYGLHPSIRGVHPFPISRGA